MKPNKTNFDFLRVLVGVVLAIGGAVLLFFAGLSGFSDTALTVTGAIVFVAGMLITLNKHIAQVIFTIFS